jgi:hypothetical protein
LCLRGCGRLDGRDFFFFSSGWHRVESSEVRAGNGEAITVNAGRKGEEGQLMTKMLVNVFGAVLFWDWALTKRLLLGSLTLIDHDELYVFYFCFILYMICRLK